MTNPQVSIAAPTGTPPELSEIGFTDTTWDQPWNLVRGHQTMAERMPTAILAPGTTIPLREGPRLHLEGITVPDPLLGGHLGLETLLSQRLHNDGLLVIHKGVLLLEQYRNGMTPSTHHVVHSCSKTLTAMLVGWAIDQGVLTTDTQVCDVILELAGIPAWQGVTVQHLLDMAAGFDTEEHYEEASSMYWRYAKAVGYYGASGDDMGVLDFVERELTNRVAEPGTVFNYASYLSNLLPILVERASGTSALDLLHEHVYSRIGAEHPALINVDRFGRPIVEGQVNLTLRDFARWAYLLINDGRNLAEEQVAPMQWVTEAFTSSPERRAAFERSDYSGMFPHGEYHNQAWLIDPRSQHLAMLGIHGQFAFIDRMKDLLIVGLSSFPDQANALVAHYMQSTWGAISRAVDHAV